MTEDSPGRGPQPSPDTGTDVPHSARIWNYWLGGDVNFPVDREAGDQYRQVYPEIVDAAVAAWPGSQSPRPARVRPCVW
jgi:hypothetical protein